MLKFEATFRAKLLCTLVAFLLFLNASLGLYIFIPRLFIETLSGGEHLDTWSSLATALTLFCFVAFYLHWSLVRGNIHTRLIANSRTLAVARPGRRVEYIKRADCIGTAQYGNFFLMADGTKRPARYPLAFFLREQRDFLPALYELWWPGREFKRDGSC